MLWLKEYLHIAQLSIIISTSTKRKGETIMKSIKNKSTVKSISLKDIQAFVAISEKAAISVKLSDLKKLVKAAV